MVHVLLLCLFVSCVLFVVHYFKVGTRSRGIVHRWLAINNKLAPNPAPKPNPITNPTRTLALILTLN